MKNRQSLLAALGITAALLLATAARAADDYQAALDDVKATFGVVPQFIAKFPKAGLPGAWAEMKSLLLNPNTALDPKTKALIAVGVTSAIGCQACIWMDTNEAIRAGASEEEVREAIGIAAPIWGTYRQWAERGCQVRRGEKASPVIFYKEYDTQKKAAREIACGGPVP